MRTTVTIYTRQTLLQALRAALRRLAARVCAIVRHELTRNLLSLAVAAVFGAWLVYYSALDGSSARAPTSAVRGLPPPRAALVSEQPSQGQASPPRSVLVDLPEAHAPLLVYLVDAETDLSGTVAAVDGGDAIIMRVGTPDSLARSLEQLRVVEEVLATGPRARSVVVIDLRAEAGTG